MIVCFDAHIFKNVRPAQKVTTHHPAFTRGTPVRMNV